MFAVVDGLLFCASHEVIRRLRWGGYTPGLTGSTAVLWVSYEKYLRLTGPGVGQTCSTAVLSRCSDNRVARGRDDRFTRRSITEVQSIQDQSHGHEYPNVSYDTTNTMNIQTTTKVSRIKKREGWRFRTTSSMRCRIFQPILFFSS